MAPESRTVTADEAELLGKLLRSQLPLDEDDVPAELREQTASDLILRDPEPDPAPDSDPSVRH